jgi:hypothetical protein
MSKINKLVPGKSEEKQETIRRHVNKLYSKPENNSSNNQKDTSLVLGSWIINFFTLGTIYLDGT